MTFLLDIINGIHRFLGYLDISPKYLNRGYTILSIIPTVYILRIIFGLAQNKNYLQLILYSLIFLMLVYFLVLNICYYFLGKNLKIDVTQLFVKYLPDEAFNIEVESANANKINLLTTEKVPVDFHEDYQLILAEYLSELMTSGAIVHNTSVNEGYVIAKNTLYPYYFIKKISDKEYALQIGKSYSKLTTIGKIERDEKQGSLEPVGLFIAGGDFIKDGVRYHEPYQLKLYVKKNVDRITVTSRREYQKKRG